MVFTAGQQNKFGRNGGVEKSEMVWYGDTYKRIIPMFLDSLTK